MKVVVTGGTGFIGSHTCLALHQAGIEPVLLDNLSNSSSKVLDQLAKISGQRFQFIEGDIADSQLMQQVLQQHQPQAVLHFAALKAVGESTQQPLRYYQNNVAATLSMLQSMQQCGVTQLVFSSSATVYGDPDYLPIDEQHPIRATSPYGWSKVMVEQLLQDLVQADPNWLAITLRYFNPVGAHPSGLLGESPNGIPNNLLPYIAQTAVGKRPFVSVYGSDYDTKDGTGVRDYIHVMDLAHGHVAALLKLQQQQGFHAFNLGTGQGYSVLDMLHAFAAAAGKEIPYQLAARRPGDIASSYADASKARRELNWQTLADLTDMTRDTWRWQQNYPAGLEEV